MKLFKLSAIFVALMTVNCFMSASIAAQNNQGNQTSEQKTTAASQSPDFSADGRLAFKNQSNEKYRIGLQDTIDIQVVKHPELSQTVNINSDGTIMMPRLNKPIVAVCKTERELSEIVAGLYRATILQNPFVNVRVVDQKSQPVAVLGAVEKPGAFNLNRPIQLLQLLSLAGGPKIDKAGAKIQVARMGDVSGCSDEKNEEVQFLGFNTRNVMSGKETLEIKPGDIVSVLDAEEAYIVGNVKKPTKVSLKEPVTLTQAIAAAEGLDDTAKTDKIIIQRQQSDSPAKTELAFNLKDIRDKKIADPQLQANDIVEVSNDGTKTAKKKIIDAFTGGLGNIFYRFPL